MPVITRVGRVQTGTDRYLVGSLTDISALKARERQLVEAQREAEALHRDLDSILQSLPVAVLILDRRFRHRVRQSGVLRYLGMAAEQRLEGTPFRNFVRVSFDRGWYVDYGTDFDAAYRRRIEELTTQYASTSTSSSSQRQDAHHHQQAALPATRFWSRTSIFPSCATASRRSARRVCSWSGVGQFMQDATRVMAQGLLVVEDSRIVLSNDATAEILHVPADLVVPDRRWDEIFEYCANRGDFGYDAAQLLAAWSEKHPPRAGRFPRRSWRQAPRGCRWRQASAAQGRWMFVLTISRR